MTAKTIDVFSPIDGHLIESYPVTNEAEITACYHQARTAAQDWADQTVKQRLIYIRAIRQQLINDLETITEQLVTVTGKVKTEILMGEIYPLMEMLRYYEKNAEKILSSQSVSTSPLGFPNAEAYYSYRPYGVVAVISPWNFPLQLTLYPLLSALIAGNAVIFKPSELSLPVAEIILSLCNACGLPKGLVQYVMGEAETGQQLIAQHPDLVFFTGGLQAGRRVMQAAAQHPVPVILELGGKDAMLVLADAQIERAINATLYGAFSNSGQVCISTELLYIEATIFNDFLDRLCQRVTAMTVGHGQQGDVGAISSTAQLAIIEAHYQDAIAKGAKASAPLSIQGHYVRPVVLWNIQDDMRLMQEETFGPLLAVIPFTDVENVITTLNATEHGLNASVWSQNIKHAVRIAERLQVGNWVVNDVLKNAGHPRLPFGGVKNSGFGRYHGAEGLRSFCYSVSAMLSHNRFEREPNWFPYSDESFTAMRAFIDTLFADDSLWQRLRRNARALSAYQEYAALNLKQHWRNFLILIGRTRN